MRSQNNNHNNNNSEFSLVIINGLMHHYLDERWMVMGQSRIGIYHDTINNTFRIVGRKLDNFEVVANCSINESFCYNKATTTFHQWRDIIDEHLVYGVKFQSIDDAILFGDTIEKIVDSSEKMASRMVALVNNNQLQQQAISSNNSTGNLTGNEYQQQQQNSTFNSAFQPQQQQEITCVESLSKKKIMDTNNNDTSTNNNNLYNHQIMVQINQQQHHNGASSNHQMTPSQQQQLTNNQNDIKSENNLDNTALQDEPTKQVNQASKPCVPPTPPPIPPHLKIPPKPKISVKPEGLSSLLNNQSKNPLKSTNSNPSIHNNTMNGTGMHPSKSTSNLIDEMAQTLARRRAKIEEAENNNNNNQQQLNASSGGTIHNNHLNQTQTTNVVNGDNCVKPQLSNGIPVPPPPPPPTAPTTPIKFNSIRKFNSVSNGTSNTSTQYSSTTTSFMNGSNTTTTFMNGSTTSLTNGHHNNNNGGAAYPKTTNQKFNSMINIANGNGNHNHSNYRSNQSSRAQSPTTTSSSPTIPDKLKDDILQEIRQELNQFKLDLINAIRTELFSNLNK